MESYSLLCGEKMSVTDQVRGYQLQQKCVSTLGPDLALMLRRGAHMLASVLERGAHKLALKLRSYTCLCFDVET